MVRTLDSHLKAVSYMGVGKVVLCSHGVLLHSVKWECTMLRGQCIFCSRNKKRGRIWFGIVCLKLYQFERITWWCLFALESILNFVVEYALHFVMVESIKKSHGLLEFASRPPDENFGRPRNLIHSPSCRTPCRLFIHDVFFGPLGLHLRVWSEFGQSLAFWPMRTLRLQWSRAFNLVCEVALSITILHTWCQESWEYCVPLVLSYPCKMC